MHHLFIGSRKIASIGLSFCHGSGALMSLHDPMDTKTLANELASREPCCKKRNKLCCASSS